MGCIWAEDLYETTAPLDQLDNTMKRINMHIGHVQRAPFPFHGAAFTGRHFAQCCKLIEILYFFFLLEARGRFCAYLLHWCFRLELWVITWLDVWNTEKKARATYIIVLRMHANPCGFESSCITVSGTGTFRIIPRHFHAVLHSIWYLKKLSVVQIKLYYS